MKVSTRIFFCYLVISSICLYYPFDWILDTMRTRYLEGVEDPLVDQANTLATLVEYEMQRGGFDPQKWYSSLEKAGGRRVAARIYQLFKEKVDTLLYITDDKGIVIFHSRDPVAVGKDFSAWRDVHLTLKGEYGARTSQVQLTEEASSVLYVAAPIMQGERIAGVLTVGKPTTNISWFVKNAKLQVIGIGLLALLAAWLLSFVVSRWITRPIKRLTDYADAISNEQRPEIPQLDSSEIGEMGKAFMKMQEALEGKRYVEQYIQNLTHEIKSPLSAIRGAAELLAEPMAGEQRARFLGNIQNESLRIQKIIDRMLELSALENRKKLSETQQVPAAVLLRTVLESLETSLAKKQLHVQVTVPDDIYVVGDSFLLHQAMGNLIQNAIDFSPAKATIGLSVEHFGEKVRFAVTDEGTGIAEFARQRIFEKFFSVQRPDTGQKSTGLGLNFVRQVALLHGGEVRLENREGKGVRAELEIAALPLQIAP